MLEPIADGMIPAYLRALPLEMQLCQINVAKIRQLLGAVKIIKIVFQNWQFNIGNKYLDVYY